MKHVELTDEELSVLIDLSSLIPGNQGQVLKEKLLAASQQDDEQPDYTLISTRWQLDTHRIEKEASNGQ